MRTTEFDLEKVITVLASTKIDYSNVGEFPINKVGYLIRNLIGTLEEDNTVKVDSSIEFEPITHHFDFRQHNFIRDDYKTYDTYYGITRLTFNGLYAKIIIKLSEDGQIKFNLVDFPKLYKFLVDNKSVFKSYDLGNNEVGITSNVWLNAKVIINCAYGFLISKQERPLFSDLKVNLVQKFLIEGIVNKFSFCNCVAGDTDVFYFDIHDDTSRGVLALVLDEFSKLGLTYELEKVDIRFADNHKYNSMIRSYRRSKGLDNTDTNFKSLLS